jgi:restriction endonuclease
VLSRRLAGDSISERERAIEAVYFAQEEKKLLKKLAKKAGLPSQECLNIEEKAVKEIFAKHKVEPTSSLVNDLIAHFHTHP